MRIIRAILRIFANYMFIPSVRHSLLRLSGIKIGKDSFINMNVLLIDSYRGKLIEFGDRCAIAPGAAFIATSDPNNSKLRKINSFNKIEKVIIEDDVWIGTFAIIMPGIKIGKCSVIGSGSVVTKNVDDFSIVVGNPGRKVGDIRNKEGYNENFN